MTTPSSMNIRLLLAWAARGPNKWAQAVGGPLLGTQHQVTSGCPAEPPSQIAHQGLHVAGVQLHQHVRGLHIPPQLASNSKLPRGGGRSRYQLDEQRAGGSSVEAEFYLNLNSDRAHDPHALAKQKGAIQGFVSGIKELLAQSAAKAGTGPNATPDVPRSEPAFTLQLPKSFPEDPSKMFQDTLRVMVRLTSLPVEPWHSYESGNRDSRVQRQWVPVEVAKQLVADLNVLLAGMEALPKVKRRTSFYNVLLCALAHAGDTEGAEALYTRMAAMHKGPSCQPDLESASQLFSAYVKSGDLQGMFKTLESISSSKRLRDAYQLQLPALLGRLSTLCVRRAARSKAPEVVEQVLDLLEQLTTSNALERPVTLSNNLLVELMAEAAGADRLDLAMRFWDKLQAQGSQGVHHIEEGACEAVLLAAARAPDAQAAYDAALKVFTALKASLAAMQAAASATGAASPQLYVPSVTAYQAYIQVLGQAKEWAAAFDCVHELAAHHAATEPDCVSAVHGLAPLAQAIFKTPGAAAAAYDVLVKRQLQGQPVSSAMMNVVLRGMALTGSVDLVSKLFEEYEVAGLTQDTGAYNAVLEACTVAAQPMKAASVMEYMEIKGVAASIDTWDLLMRSYLAAGEVQGALATMLDMRKMGVPGRLGTLEQAVAMAAQCSDASAELEFSTELDFQKQQRHRGRL